MKPHLKTVNVQTVPALTEDGELYTAYKNIDVVITSDEQYFMTYTHLMGYSFGCKSFSEFKFLAWISHNLSYNESVIFLNKYNKTKAMEDTKLSLSAINKAIKAFTLSKILVMDTRYPKSGTYFVNPAFIWKGDSATRNKELRTTLTLIKEAHTPDKELETLKDIERYKQYYKEESKN